ncbi:MAG: transposase [Saprospiraceae bacterium]|nr:transposase [Saprospiraceae bacterium]
MDQLFPSVEKETWIVMDNAPTHKSKKFTEKILEWAKKKINILFLPAYSPELNPIEIVWRFIKYYWLPLSAYQSFQKLAEALNDILANYGKKYLITFA